MRHFYTQHRNTYEIKKMEELKKQESTLNSKKESNNVSIVIKNCVNLLTVHGRPFSLLQDEAFQNLIKLIPDMKNNVICTKSIRSKIEEKAYDIRRKIHDEAKNKLLCLKVDIASIKSRRFLGVNLQYIKDAKLILRNLSVLELQQRNTGDFLKETILMVLSRFGIEVKQLYSLTVDNGANMLAMSRQITDLQALVDGTDDHEDSAEDNFDSDTNETNQHSSDNLEKELEFEEDILNVISFKMTAVRCAAHTLQLAIKDACLELHPFLEQCRHVVRILRTPNIVLELKNNKFQQAILDCPTRWDSTVNMLERLMKLREYCSNNYSRFDLEEDLWAKIHETVQALKPCRQLSKILQKEQLTMGDFYINWLRCKLETENINTSLARNLALRMTERERILLENDVFLSAVYLDPRVNSTLSDDQCQRAKNHLVATYERYTFLTLRESTSSLNQDSEDDNYLLSHSTSTIDDNQFLESASNNIQHQSSSDDYYAVTHASSSTAIATSNTEIDEFLQRQHRLRRNLLENSTQADQLHALLKNFLNEPLLRSNANILEFWKSRKCTHPQLYFLSEITLSTPPTQVSVERLFSSLKFVLNNLRMSLKDTIIEDILIVRNNTIYNK